MDFKIVILVIIVPLLNFIVSFFILKANNKQPSNVFFALLCVIAGLWTLGMGLLHCLLDINILEKFILNSTVIFSSFVPFFYLLFSIAYPFQKKIITKSSFFVILPLLITVSILLGIFEVEKIYFENNKLVEEVIFNNYLLFAVYFFSYIILGFIILFKKYYSLDGIYKCNIKYILFSTIFTFLVVTYLSIILPLINKYFFDWYSPIFTLINFMIISYLIFYKSK